MSKFLIVGAGISGCSAAVQLAEDGHQVMLLDRASGAGGKITEYACKATSTCSLCGVCVAAARIRQALNRKEITFLPSAFLREVNNDGKTVSVQVEQGSPRIDYQKCLRCDLCVRSCPQGSVRKVVCGELVGYSIDTRSCPADGSCRECAAACPAGAIAIEKQAAVSSLQADAVLVSSGHQPFRAAKDLRFGYGRFPAVLTAVEAEALLRGSKALNPEVKSIAFIQCVGSRDPRRNRNYCSGVCCGYALRLARMIRHYNPHVDVSIYYIDLQNFDKTFTLLKKELIGAGIHFRRCIPGRIEQASGGALTLHFESEAGEPGQAQHDMIILSVGLGPEESAPELAGLFGLERNREGFFSSSLPNVYVSGTCERPAPISECMTRAAATASRMVRCHG
jgi:heterodisulfide reductase subunit A-like polyferredoxin